MHPGAPKARRHIGNISHTFIRPYEAAEHQATVFGSEFLAPESEIRNYSSAQDLAIHFGISVEAAQIRFRDPAESAYRADRAAKLEILAN